MSQQIRDRFPMLQKKMHGQPLIYLDSGATAQKPLEVIDCLNHFYRECYGTVHRAVYELSVASTKAYNEARAKVQGLLNAKELEEIVFTRGTTESINLVATSFCKRYVQPGDQIVISEMEHHSNIVPWQIACEDFGAELLIIPVLDNGELDLVAYKDLLGPKVKLVAVTHLSNVLGTVNPIEEICKLAHSVNAKVLVDGAQAAPRLAVDVQKMDCDFYVFSGHKFYGPTGIGALYGRRELLEEMPPYQGGGDMIERVTFEKTTYNVLPMKFEAGTPIIAEAIGLGAACDFIQRIGFEEIEKHEKALVDRALELLSEMGDVHILGSSQTRCGVVAFTVDSVHHLDLGTLLDLKGVAIRTGHHCAQPLLDRFGLTGTARISFGVYNTLEEVDLFVEYLQQVIAKLKN